MTIVDKNGVIIPPWAMNTNKNENQKDSKNAGKKT